MPDQASIIVGLEIGTTKICAVVSTRAEQGALNIIGLGQCRSRGVRKGEVVNHEWAAEDLRHAIADAEQMADVEVRRVFLGVTGSHIRGVNNRGAHPIRSDDRVISSADVKEVIKIAKAANLPSQNYNLHSIRQHFQVDDVEGILNPEGMVGSRLELGMHQVQGSVNRLQNTVKVVRDLQLEVDDVVFNGLAASLAVLTTQQKQDGALVIDLGAGTTEYVVYANGVIKHTGVLAVGGEHVTNDLAFGLKVPLSRAEQLKVANGAAVAAPGDKGQTIEIPAEVGLAPRTVNLDHLRRIMAVRIEEVFGIIAEDLQNAGPFPYLRAGVVLCGGGARTPGIVKAAEAVFELPVTLGANTAIGGLAQTLDQPEFSTALGLAKYGSFQDPKTEARFSLREGLLNTFGNWFKAR